MGHRTEAFAESNWRALEIRLKQPYAFTFTFGLQVINKLNALKRTHRSGREAWKSVSCLPVKYK